MHTDHSPIAPRNNLPDPVSIDRRDALKWIGLTALAVPSLELISGCAQKPEDYTFDQVLDQLHASGFIIRESKQLGSETVVVIGDIHNRDVQLKNYADINRIRSIFPFDTICLEQFWKGFPKNATSIQEETYKVVDPSLIGKPNDYSLLPYYQFFGHSDLRCIGGCSETSAVEQNIVSDLIHNYTSIEGNVSTNRKAYILIQDGQPSPLLQRINRCSDFVHNRYPDFPTLDLSKVHPLVQQKDRPTPPKGALGFDVSDAEYLGHFRERLLAWLDRNWSPVKNSFAVSELCSDMRQSGSSRGLILFGIAHTYRELTQPTIQDLLAEQNASYIVIDTISKDHPGMRELFSRPQFER